jgi:hypothetical protein
MGNRKICHCGKDSSDLFIFRHLEADDREM